MAIDSSLFLTRSEVQNAAIPAESQEEFWRHFDAAAAIEGTPDELAMTEWLAYFQKLVQPHTALHEAQRSCGRLGKSTEYPYNQSFTSPPEACRRFEAMERNFEDKMVSVPMQRLFYNLFLADRPQAEREFRHDHPISVLRDNPMRKGLSLENIRGIHRILATTESNDVLMLSVRFDSEITKDRVDSAQSAAERALVYGLELFDDDTKNPENANRLSRLIANRFFLDMVQESCSGKPDQEYSECVKGHYHSGLREGELSPVTATWVRKVRTLGMLAEILQAFSRAE